MPRPRWYRLTLLEQEETTMSLANTTPIIAAIYCRVSSKGQEDNYSLASQEANCRQHAERERYTVAEEHVYRDVASGFSLDRSQLTRLREALRRGELDAVIVNSFDRWASTDKDSYRLYTDLEDGSATLESVTQGKFEDTPTGRLVMSAYTLGRELWLEDHVERSMRGRRARVASGKLLAGNRAPYGYMYADDDQRKSVLVPNPETAPIVQRLFREIAAGKTARSLCLQLTAEGVPTATGGSRWGVTTVTTYIRNPIYYGEPAAFRFRQEKRPNGRKVTVPRDASEHVVIPGGAPALVSKEVALQAMARLPRNKSESKRNNRNPEAALLRAGIAICGYCERALATLNSAKHGAHYECNGVNRDRHDCPHYTIQASILDPAVWAHVQGILTHPDIIAAELARMRTSDPTVGDVKAVERQLDDIERKRHNLVKRLADVEDEDIAAMVQVELVTLTKHAKQLEEDRDTLRRQREIWAQAQVRFNDIEVWCRNVAANVDDLTYDQKRTALDALGVKVRVWRGDHNPRWKINARIPFLTRSNSRSTIRIARSID
jgi:site-specific DNA recombinase